MSANTVRLDATSAQQAGRPNTVTLTFCLLHIIDPHITQQAAHGLDLLRVYGYEVESTAEDGSIDVRVEEFGRARDFDAMREWLKASVQSAECSANNLTSLATIFEDCLKLVARKYPHEDILGLSGRAFLINLLCHETVRSKRYHSLPSDSLPGVVQLGEASQQSYPEMEDPVSVSLDTVSEGSPAGWDSEGTETREGSEAENHPTEVLERQQAAASSSEVARLMMQLRQGRAELERITRLTEEKRRRGDEKAERLTTLAARLLELLPPDDQASFPRSYLERSSERAT